MSTKNKIIMFIVVALIIMAIVSPNEITSVLSAIGVVVLVVAMRVSDWVIKRKLIKKIERESIDHIKVKENNKWEILLMIVIMLNTYTMMKSRYDLFVSQSSSSTINLTSYINSLNTSEKMAEVACVVLIILAILCIAQVLLSKCIVSRDKVIFYDGQIFDIKDIEQIDYLESSSKNYKKIKLGKGFIDRKIIINIEDLEKVKTLLENKNS
ncbi:MAG: hypothetical protein ACRDA3_06960 [Peptostreptococcaceae bacterium]